CRQKKCGRVSPWLCPANTYLLLFCITANLLSIYVLCFRPCGMSKTTVIYLVSLAVVDTLFLVLGGLMDVILSLLHHPTIHYSIPLCGIITFNEYWTLFSSQWIVSAFTLERYIIMRNDRLRRRFSQPRVALSVVLVVVVLSQLVSIPGYWLYEPKSIKDLHKVWGNYSHHPVPYQCLYHNIPVSKVVVWVHIILSGFVPMTITIFFSILIAFHFKKKAGVFHDSQSTIFSITRARLRRSFRVQVSVAVSTVVLTLPRYVTYTLLGTDRRISEQQRQNPEDPVNIAASVGLMLQWLDLVINFCLYCFASSAFRNESSALLRCGWAKQTRKNVVHPVHRPAVLGQRASHEGSVKERGMAQGKGTVWLVNEAN
ncbi:probable G-protein coupled receptor 139, partial [Erpetoichthys calabaricus]|uniref:probable G-protein coupled receptor 139 n=1 Tax=Erpetoichthys calabaricus TaxID=27687 RepID=UPI0022349AE5